MVRGTGEAPRIVVWGDTLRPFKVPASKETAKEAAAAAAAAAADPACGTRDTCLKNV
jgi:hypothetical protein